MAVASIGREEEGRVSELRLGQKHFGTGPPSWQTFGLASLSAKFWLSSGSRIFYIDFMTARKRITADFKTARADKKTQTKADGKPATAKPTKEELRFAKTAADGRRLIGRDVTDLSEAEFLAATLS